MFFHYQHWKLYLILKGKKCAQKIHFTHVDIMSQKELFWMELRE